MATSFATIFNQAINKKTFPGGVVWLAHDDNVLAHEAFGTTAYDDAISQPVTRDTIYDIASLTKLFTAAVFFIAARDANVFVYQSLSRILPEFNVSDKRDITLRQLLNHSSGIEFAVQSLIALPVEDWMPCIVEAPLHAAPGEKVLYSCTNYFLLGRVIEKFSGKTLNHIIESQILQPLRMTRTTFWPLKKFKLDEIAPTEIDATTNAPWHGVVHDEAARTWMDATETACGNSGLFSTAADLAKFAQLWLDEGAYDGQQIIAPEDVRNALSDTVPEDDHWRGWCWQIDAVFFMSEKAPSGTAGHAGFTGPTLFLNPTTRHIAIILNNRVHPTRDGPTRFPTHRRLARWLLRS